ncbi:fetuin-B isoform X1 [Phoca vitulina]|uniref:fetuin-B n=1 Tax=Halichoerus grypus TaxID=9711 RepID=UPI001395EFBF|nr:fetuin-B isoform X1 [Phoca vitulina]XP_035922571.1 fetuin-B [Halichoerus grypus]
MGLLLPLVLCTLAACCRARSPPMPPMPPLPLSVLPRGCNDSDVLTAADFALQDINRDRKDGYMLRLNRVSDVREHRQVDLGSLFYLTLDVLETGCHVLTRKAWKDCEMRELHRSVYGQCKAIFYVNMPARILYLPAYNCTLRPVSQRRIHSMCPDCPTATDLSNPKVLEAALESLAKYNSESTSKQYSLVQVTHASSQWVFGPSYFVEYLIRELPCTKSQASSCALQPHDSEPVGLCKGSVTKREIEKFVSVTCDFFERQVPAPGGEDPAVNQGPAHLPGLEESQQKIVCPSPNLPPKAVPKGSVLYLPDLVDEKQPEDAEENSPVEAFPVKLDLTTNPRGESLDVSFLFLGPGEEKLVVLPFPKEAQRSAECPGPAQQDNTLILPP